MTALTWIRDGKTEVPEVVRELIREMEESLQEIEGG